MYFVDQEHKAKFFKLINGNHVLEQNVQIVSLFYILSANSELYSKVHNIYNSKEHTIVSNSLDKLSLSSSSRSLLQLGFKLFDGSCREYKDVSNLFSKLDKKNFEVCMYAVRISLGNIELNFLN